MPLITQEQRRDFNRHRARAQTEPCIRAGKELTRKAKEEVAARRNYANKEIQQASKEAATFLRNKSRGKRYFIPN